MTPRRVTVPTESHDHGRPDAASDNRADSDRDDDQHGHRRSDRDQHRHDHTHCHDHDHDHAAQALNEGAVGLGCAHLARSATSLGQPGARRVRDEELGVIPASDLAAGLAASAWVCHSKARRL